MIRGLIKEKQVARPGKQPRETNTAFLPTRKHLTQLENIVTLIQPHYQLVIVLSKADTAGFAIEKAIPTFQSLATRIEILMGSIPAYSEETILGKIVEEIPEINQAMLLTVEGLPLSSVGFMNQIEIAGIAGSIFANGLTYSLTTGEIEINAEDIRLLLYRVDDAKLLLVICRGPNARELSERVKKFLMLMP